MPLHNIEDHTSCAYYATDDNALFRQYCLNDNQNVSGMNDSRSVLLYVAEGSLRVTLGHFTSCTIGCGSLIFAPKNIVFYGRAVGSCHLIASFFSAQVPLCNKYDLVDLEHDARPSDGGNYPPPPENFHDYL